MLPAHACNPRHTLLAALELRKRRRADRPRRRHARRAAAQPSNRRRGGALRDSRSRDGGTRGGPHPQARVPSPLWRAPGISLTSPRSSRPAATIVTPLLVVLLTCAVSPLQAETPKPSSCLIQPDKAVAVAQAAGSAVLCGIDLGSRSINLSLL